MRYVKYLMALAMTGLLAACGGGGGSAGTPIGGGGGTTPTPSVPTLVVTVINSSDAVVPSISAGGAYTARATLKDASGAAIANRLVTFALSDQTTAKLTPTTALTNASGIAQVAVEPVSLSALGAATLTATATVDTATITGTTDFAVSASSLVLSPLVSSSSALASGGNATLTTTASISGVPAAGIPVNVAFAASCGRINGQDASAGSFGVTTNGSGVAEVSYTAVAADGKPCSGAVTLTATSPGATSQSTTVTVAAPIANTLTFVSATPDQIFVAGSGAVEQSVVSFRVLSSVGSALANVPVDFSIDTNPGGVGIGASGSTASVRRTSDQDGLVSVSLFSGTIPGPVKLRATLIGSSPAVFAESQNLTVASGPPSQRFMSLSVSRTSLEGWAIDGTPSTFTVRLADRQGNAVNDGTVVNFTAEGGQIARSCATTRVNGISSCSVEFVTQNPRTADGRITVMAHTSGTKDYVDVNGNNIYDAGVDQLAVMGDAYRDDNENNVADVGEFFVPRGGTGSCPSAGGAFPSKSNTCDSGLATTVRQQAVVLYGSSMAAISAVQATAGSVSFRLHSADNLLLPMPAGTAVSGTGAPTTCTVAEVAGAPVVDVRPTIGQPGESLATAVRLTLNGCVLGNSVSIKITAPSGLTTTFSVPLQ
ncbi:hypothetical protein [Pseudorhodoferax sp. Leaf267]|uniref:hypothetical protein n=1 Tax=Pseudorhodoferax sp. Leaf267 TaxID=1736316 RepID=UPI000A9AFC99|nr:hypothetical protein [Pseudorhodoferax sp. Leaf267]